MIVIHLLRTKFILNKILFIASNFFLLKKCHEKSAMNRCVVASNINNKIILINNTDLKDFDPPRIILFWYSFSFRKVVDEAKSVESVNRLSTHNVLYFDGGSEKF